MPLPVADEELASVIKGGKSNMPRFKYVMSDDESIRSFVCS